MILKFMEIEYEYNAEKNIKLKEQRGISFEEIIYYINNGHLLDVVQHPNKNQYAGQRFYLVNVDDYVHLVPFVREGTSRKHTKKYLEQIASRRGKTHE